MKILHISLVKKVLAHFLKSVSHVIDCKGNKLFTGHESEVLVCG